MHSCSGQCAFLPSKSQSVSLKQSCSLVIAHLGQTLIVLIVGFVLVMRDL